MDLIKKIVKRSGIILLPVAFASSFLGGWRLPAGVLAGGLLALLNIKGLAWGVQGLLGTEKATVRMLFFSQFRFIMMIMAFAIIIYLRLVNVFGILAGVTIVFAVVLFEGYRNSRDVIKRSGQLK
jgi:hypothetical protein